MSDCCYVRLRVNKQKMKEVVNEYTLLWRGLLGTEYAAQTAGLFGRWFHRYTQFFTHLKTQSWNVFQSAWRSRHQFIC